MTERSDTYVFGQHHELEQARLAGLSAQFDATTVRHLTALGLDGGVALLEVGGGAGSIAAWMAAQVGDGGHVLVTDIDTRFLDGLASSWVEVRAHDITAGPLPDGPFDVVHERAVLEHVAGRDDVVGALASTLRPGGVLLLEDMVFGGPFAQTLQPVVRPVGRAEPMTRVLDAMAAGFRGSGADATYGLQLTGRIVAAGLVDVGAELVSRLVWGGTDESVFYRVSLDNVGPRLVAAGLLGADDLEAAIQHCDDPHACWFSLGLVSAWG